MSKQPLELGLNFYKIYLLDPNFLCPQIPEMLLEESRRKELFYEIVHLDQGKLASHSSQYSLKYAQESTDFFTKRPDYGNKRYDRFRYVIAD